MRTSSIIAALAVISAATPTLAFPLPTEEGFSDFEARDLEARFKLPTGLLAKLKGPLVKELGKGLLTGGAFSALGALLSGSSSSTAPPARRAEIEAEAHEAFEVQARDLEARFKLPTGLLTKLKGPLVKELGKGLLTGGAFSALGALLSGGSSSTAAAPPARRQVDEDDDDYEIQARDLEARFKLPTGLLAKLKGPLVKELGKGLLTGGAFSALGALLSAGSSNTAAAPAPARRELSDEEDELTRRGISSLLTKLLGDTGKLSSIIKNGIFGGLASGAAIGGSNAILGQPSRRAEEEDLTADDIELLNALLSLPASSVKRSESEDLTEDDLKLLNLLLSSHDKRSLGSSLAKLFAGGAGTAIKKGLVNGVGSAFGGVAIGGLLAKLTGTPAQRRAVDDNITDEELLLALIAASEDAEKEKRDVEGFTEEEIDILTALANSPQKREPAFAASLAKLFSGGAATAIKKGLVNGVGSAFGGVAIGGLLAKLTGGSPAKREEYVTELEARDPLSLGPIGKGLIGTGVGLAASTAASSLIDKLRSLFGRDFELLEEMD